MNKKQFDKYFRWNILPVVIRQFESDGIADKVARREYWNNTLDQFVRCGWVCSLRAHNWVIPDVLETVNPQRRLHFRYCL